MIFDLKDVVVPSFIQSKEEEEIHLTNKVFVVNSLGKGGTGKSTFAANLAKGYRMLGYSVVLCDFCLPYGDQMVIHNSLEEDKSLLNWVKAPIHLDTKLTNELLIETKDGIKLLPSLQHIHEERFVNHQWLAEKIVRNLADFDVIIIDTSQLTELTIGAMKQATNIFLLSEPDAVALSHVNKGFEYLRTQEIDSEKMVLVLNKVMPRTKLNIEHFLQLGIKRVFEIPYEPKIHNRMGNKVMPLLYNSKNKMSKSLQEITEQFKPNKNHMGFEKVGEL